MSAGDPRVIVALDFAEPGRALALVDRLDPAACALKVGKELFVAAGPEPVRWMIERGFRVFLDLKFHDIPNTVAQACAAATRLGVWMMNVHASGGRAMMQAAREAVARTAAERALPRPLLIAVTVLTSLDGRDLAEIGMIDSAKDEVLRLAKLAAACDLDGVVCSAAEAAALRRALGPRFKLVTPGIRPAGAASDDQARVATPEAALANGADYLVIGRPITQAADPPAALRAINALVGALA
ncbi:MAG TPA: orotidine-5'-phosphate decarboxylase [Casimicrobiaceae bacterium]|nr:orotidine-5'-phosphate decarboxylase [Casimicrobiaceae bacterium]